MRELKEELIADTKAKQPRKIIQKNKKASTTAEEGESRDVL